MKVRCLFRTTAIVFLPLVVFSGQACPPNGEEMMPAPSPVPDEVAAGDGVLIDNGIVSLDTAFTDGLYWKLDGNTGTTAGVNFLGTTDDQPLELHVNGTRAMRLEPTTNCPNVIGGFDGNTVTSGVVAATIAGGGPSNPADPSTGNAVFDDFGTIGGGANNKVGRDDGNTSLAVSATIGGGSNNRAAAVGATIGGGQVNDISGADHGVIGGGTQNRMGSDANGATIGGGDNNIIDSEAGGSTISGGNTNLIGFNVGLGTISGGFQNQLFGPQATIGGGGSNTAAGRNATVGGGRLNQASADFSTIGGGGPSDIFDPANTNNRVFDEYGTIGGGGNNQVGVNDGDTTSQDFATVCGGQSNTASAFLASVGGGIGNTASGDDSTIGGGRSNSARGTQATVGGGVSNMVNDKACTVAGGEGNRAGLALIPVGPLARGTTGNHATVAGGNSNVAENQAATVGGGTSNRAGGDNSTVGGGKDNDAGGFRATIPGGIGNVAAGSVSFAAGSQAQATHDGAFVWADSGITPLASFGDDTFSARASGGTRFYSSSNSSTGVELAAGGGAWAALSDRNAKENFKRIDGRLVLERLCSIAIETWNYKAQDDSIRHIGPMAQDFHAAFRVGADEKRITTIDADGVALAAIQGLHQLVLEKDAAISVQQRRIEKLEARLKAIEALVANTKEISK